MRRCREIVLAAVCSVCASVALSGERWRDMVPTPKEASVLGPDWALPDGAVIVLDAFAMAQVGAEQINGKISALGSAPLAVVTEASAAAPLLLRVTCPVTHPGQLPRFRGAAPEVTAASPGPQGYVIAFAESEGRREVLLAGSDAQGVLYACVTLCWLLERGQEGLTLSRVAIRDWPDFKWRGSPSVSYVASSAEALTDEGKTTAMQRFIDWCLQRKLNVLRDYAHHKPGALPQQPVPWIAASNRYAKERGFLTFMFTMTYVRYGAADPEDPALKNCAMVNPKKLFTWADDDVLRNCTESLARYCAQNEFNLLGLHPPDGGGVMDPSQFSKRSAYDRQRWSDAQRAEADAHVFNMFYAAARRQVPDIRVGFVLYPYSPIYLDYEQMKASNPELTPELYERNVTGYYTKMAKLLPADVCLIVREGYRQHLDRYRAYFGSRALLTWCDFAARWHRQPYFACPYRFIGTSWYDADADIMSCMHTRVRPNRVDYVASAEFMWNTKAPGAEMFERQEQKLESFTHPTEPEVIFRDFVPRACRNVWGPEPGPLMTPIFQRALNPALLLQTNSVLSYVNTRLGVEPDEYIQLTSVRVAEQVAAAEAALPGLERLLQETPDMDYDAKRLVVYYYRRVRLLHVVAKLRFHILRGTERADAGNAAEAMIDVLAGKAAYAEDVPRLRDMAATTAKLPNLTRKFKIRDRDAYNVLSKYDADFDRYRRALAGLERRLQDEGTRFTALKHEGDIRVGIYDGSLDGGSAIGHRGVYLTFAGKPGIQAEFISDLSIGNLVKFGCIVYPQGTLGQSSTRYDFFTGLRRYVSEAGGAVWFMHNSVGTPRSQFGTETAFPEVCRGALERKDGNTARLFKHPITRGSAPGTSIEHGYYDHWILRRNSKAGRCVLTSDEGPIWLTGTVGEGRVLYDGTILLTPEGNTPAAAEGDYEQLMLAALRWLTQR